MKTVVLIGRILFSLIFILSSFNHFTRTTIDYAAGFGVPWAGVLVPLAGIIALIGGVSVLIGLYARVGALLLIVFLVPVTLVMHAFWASPTMAEAQLQVIMFLKNLAMLGGALLISYFGAGPYSVDSRRVTQTQEQIIGRTAA